MGKKEKPDSVDRRARPRILAGILPVQKGTVLRNVFAGIALAATAIPIDMGYTKIAGMPLVSGLYILLIPTIAFALLGFSRRLVIGADSASAAILAAGILPLAAVGSTEYAGFAALITLMVGLLLLVCRFFRLGFISNFLSRTVLSGFLAGIGIQIAISQLDDLAGMPSLSGSSPQILAGFAESLGKVNPEVVVLSAVAFAIAFVPRLFYKRAPVLRRIPFSLVAIVGGIAIGYFVSTGSFETVGAIQGGLPGITLPAFSFEAVNTLVGPSIAIVVVIITQSAAATEVYAKKYGERVDTNRDILGLSFANISAAFTGAFVANGSLTKTELADEAGASSQIANLTMAGVVLIVLLFFVAPLQFIPTAVLAAIVLTASLGLIDLRGMRRILSFNRAEFIVAVVTALVVVVLGAAQGILFAMILSLIDHIRKGYRPDNRVLVIGKDGEEWKSAAEGGQVRPGVVVYRFAASLYYANATQLSDEVRAVVADPQIHELAMDFSAVSSVDYSGCETLLEIARMLEKRGIKFVLLFPSSNTHAALAKSGLIDMVGQGNVYPTLRDYLRTHGNVIETLL